MSYVSEERSNRSTLGLFELSQEVRPHTDLESLSYDGRRNLECDNGPWGKIERRSVSAPVRS